MKFGSIADFVRFLGTREAAVMAAQQKGKEAAAKMFQRHAQDMIGEEIPQWPDLAPSTVEEKTRLGYVGQVSATDPLLRTGEYRASIKGSVEGDKVVLSSDDPVAEFHEFGTVKMPPRPVIGATVCVLSQEAADLIANHELGAAMGAPGTLRSVQRRDGELG